MIAFEYSDLKIDGSKPREWHERLLRIVADFEICSGPSRPFTEPDFCVVEFGHDLGRWLGSAKADQLDDFEYESTESEIVPLVWFRRQTAGGWAIGTADQRLLKDLALSQIVDAARTYLHRLVREVPQRLDVRIDDLVTLPAELTD